MPHARRAAIVALAILAAVTVPAASQGSGYWQLQQGGATVSFGPPGNQREWAAQGSTVLVKEASPGGALITVSTNIGGGVNTMTFRTDWKPPQQVIPGEVVGVTATGTVLALSYAHPQFPRIFDVALCQWLGIGGPVYLTQLQEIAAKAVGQTFTSTNSTVRARPPGPGMVPGAAKLTCALSLGAVYGLQATFPYAWVSGAAPTAGAAAVPAAPSTPAAPATSPAGEWNADFNGYKGPLELTPSGGGWRGRVNLGSGWEEMENLRISGTSITFDRPSGSQHYEGQLAPGGYAGTFTWGGRPYRWSAKRAVQAGPPGTGSGVSTAGGVSSAERELFFNGNVGGVSNGGKSPAVNFSAPVMVTSVTNYHWNGGAGAARGGTIALLHETGTMYGPWPVTVVTNVYWEVRPNVQLPAGRYQVIDSEPSTWAQNGASQGFGHVRIRGY